MTDIAQIELPRRPREWASPAVEAVFRNSSHQWIIASGRAAVPTLMLEADTVVGPRGRIPRKMRPPAGE